MRRNATTLESNKLYVCMHTREHHSRFTLPRLVSREVRADEDDSRAIFRIGVSRFIKLESGVRYQILNVGSLTSKPAEPGDTVVFDYVLRRDNGYFIYA